MQSNVNSEFDNNWNVVQYRQLRIIVISAHEMFSKTDNIENLYVVLAKIMSNTAT